MITSRSVPRSELRLSELSLGCAQLGNLHRAISDKQAAAAVSAAWDRGIRYFDTAPHYGLGLSERRLGRALAGCPRDAYMLSTKVGRLLEPLPPYALDTEGFAVKASHRRVWDFSRDGVLRSLEASLERLGSTASTSSTSTIPTSTTARCSNARCPRWRSYAAKASSPRSAPA